MDVYIYVFKLNGEGMWNHVWGDESFTNIARKTFRHHRYTAYPREGERCCANAGFMVCTRTTQQRPMRGRRWRNIWKYMPFLLAAEDHRLNNNNNGVLRVLGVYYSCYSCRSCHRIIRPSAPAHVINLTQLIYVSPRNYYNNNNNHSTMTERRRRLSFWQFWNFQHFCRRRLRVTVSLKHSKK